MTDVRDPASMIEAAQKAVGDGDYPAAERLLRAAAGIQEASLGSSHPDLASTLNNLAFVYERTKKFEEAERGYRRAHAIAVASLSPGHPLIATSLKNLVEFCAAHEIPIWKPPAAGPEDEAPLPDSDDEESAEFADEPPEMAIAPDDREEPVVCHQPIDAAHDWRRGSRRRRDCGAARHEARAGDDDLFERGAVSREGDSRSSTRVPARSSTRAARSSTRVTACGRAGATSHTVEGAGDGAQRPVVQRPREERVA